MTRDQYNIRLRFAYASSHGSDTNFRNQLHMHTCSRVGILQVVNELLQVFNGVNIVVRWWAN